MNSITHCKIVLFWLLRFIISGLLLISTNGFAQITNPAIAVADLVSECPDTGLLLPKFFLCGASSNRQISINSANVTAVSWEKLDKSLCPVIEENCPNTDKNCYKTVGTASNFIVSDAGYYRVIITNSNAVNQIFYFNVYQNALDIPITKSDIYCGKQGEIIVAKLTGYQYSLDGTTFQASNIFPIAKAGEYTIRVRRIGATTNDCVFSIPVTITNNDLSVIANVTVSTISEQQGDIKLTTSGVRGNYFYRITKGTTPINQVGPISESEYTFPNLNAGTYTWAVKTDDCNWQSGQVTINSISPLLITPTVQPVTCQPGKIQVLVTGGTAPYQYFFNGNATPSNLITVPVAGDYTVKVIDNNGLTDQFTVNIPSQPAPAYTIETVNENCYNPSSWQIKFNVANNNGNSLRYSIDNGVTFSTNPVFNGLSATPAGTTFKTVIEYTYGGVKCTETKDVTIIQPQFGLSAVAGVSELIGCISTDLDKARIRITNPQGGTEPYEYSFDNRASWTTSATSLHPAGKYVFYIKDKNGCVSAMPEVTVDNIGVPTVNIINNSFNCDGSSNSTIEVTTATSTSFNYNYSLDGGPFQTANNFSNISSGNHTLTVNYQPLFIPTFSNLLKEDFGYGADTTSPGINTQYYCFEKQELPYSCNNGGWLNINDGEYSVTSNIKYPFTPWWIWASAIKDHTAPLTPPIANGRFLVVNVGSTIPLTAILYQKTINDIIPNQPINVEFYAANLIAKNRSLSQPNLLVALVDATGKEISTYSTGLIPNNEEWNKHSVSLNPGNNTTLNFIVRSSVKQVSGNDVAIDDITAYQLPKLCTTTKVVNFVIPSDKAFDASITNTKNVTCAGLSNGEITISAQNYNTITGYQYSKDNGATWQTAMTSPFKITGLEAGSYAIQVRYNATASGCVKSLPTITISVPLPLTTSASITTAATCSRGATITATSLGGTPFYQYELWDELNITKIRSVQQSENFDAISPGKYTIRVIDANGCSNTALISVVAPSLPLVSLISSPDKCYDSINQATLQADVDSGTGTAPFAYSLNGGALQNSNIFRNISPGTYSIKVIDSNSCEGTTQGITIGKELKATATLVKGFDCSTAPDATINVSIDGGVRPIRYQILKENRIISTNDINLPDGNTSFIYSVSETNAATYSFIIIDANGCSIATNTVVVSPKTTPKITSITQIQSILCHGSSTAAIKVNLDTSKGIAPFTSLIKNTTTNLSYGNQLSSLPAGNYEVTVTDSNWCTTKGNITISEPEEIKVKHDSKDITCGLSGVSKGSVIVEKVTGGLPSYNYFVTGVNGYNNSELNNSGTKSYKFDVVDFGLYQINVVDSNGCSVLIQDVKVASPPNDLNIDVTTQTSNCAIGGTAKVAVSNADAFSSDGPFYFAIYKLGLTYTIGDPAWQLADANKSTIFTRLLPGVQYTFIVYDNDTGCYHYKTAESAIATNSTLEISSLTYKNISCKGSANGTISFTIKNNYSTATPISYEVFNSQSVTPIAGVAGTTTIAANGTVTITDLGNLPFGNYFVLVKEGSGAQNVGCSIASKTFNITESAIDLTVSAAVIKNVNCIEKGVISVQAKDGTAPYQYQILAISTPTPNPTGTGLVPPPPPSPVGSWQTSNTFSVNQAGTYTVWVKDAYGCEKSTVVNVTKDSEPIIEVNILNQCVNEGKFEIHIKENTAGIAPYYLSVNGSVFNPAILPTYLTNQNSGDYAITIKDNNGCTNTQIKTIYSPLVLSSKVIQFPTCKTFDGSIQAIASGGSGSYDYAISGSSLANGATFSRLNPGNYDLKLKDKITACEKIIKINLEPPTPVTGVSLSPKAVTCHGGSDGSIAVNIATPEVGINDNPVYTYSLDRGIPQTSNIFSGLLAGNFTVEVISSRNCVSSQSISIAEPAPIVVSTPKVVEFGCNSTNNLSNASISISGVTGGSGTYTQYEFIKNGAQVQFGPNPIYIESDLTGGTYYINVYDDNGCYGSTSVSIQPHYILDQINLNLITPISCNAAENIKVSAIANGGLASNIEYTLSPISGSLTGTTISSNTNGIFTGLTVGEYLITARNTVTNCSLQLVHTVNEPNTFEISIDSVVDVSCYDANTGSATITLFDQSTPSRAGIFSYDVYNSSGTKIITATTSTAGPIRIPDLKADVYSVTASLINAPFCSVTKKFTITQPTAALALNTTFSEITCAVGNSDGKITALPSGGWINLYEYKWEKARNLVHDWGDVTELTDLTLGDYTLSVRDAKGCLVSKTVQLVNPKPLTFNVSSDASLLKCFADRTATITSTNTKGGQGSNYWYTLKQITPNAIDLGTQISNEFKNLGAGTYTVTVNDNWSCEATSSVVEIQEPANLIPSLVLQTSPTCSVPAKLELNIVGGTSPYSISTDDSSFSPFSSSILNGKTGINHYFVKDNNGCGSYLSNDIVVETPKTLSVKIDKAFAKVNCKGESTATILATAQGGLGNYFYSLLDDSDNPVRPAQSTGSFTNLPAGKYKIRVSSTDCVPEDSEIITIWEPTTKLQPIFSVTDVLCTGANNGKINVSTSGGTTLIKQAISPNLSQFTETNLFDNLAIGSYDVLVQDALGCYEKQTLTIKEPASLDIQSVTSSIVQEMCFDEKNAQFSIAISGGTLPYSVSLDNPMGPYTTGTATQTQFDFTELNGGSHTVYVQDANNCRLDWTVKLNESVKLNPTTSVNYDCVSNAQHNLVTVSLDQSITDFTLVQFALDGGTYQSSNVFSNLTPGDHFVRVKYKNGCIKDTPVFTINKVDPLTLILKEGGLNEIIAEANGGGGNYKFTFDGQYYDATPSYVYYTTQDYIVSVQDANGCSTSITQKLNYIDICTPNYFTPNGDGINDTWAPGCTINYKNLSYTILDRYGRELGTYSLGQTWDGKFQGSELPSGDYWYVLKLNDSKDNREFVGHFTLYR